MFVIDRKIWYRGNGAQYSRLLRPDNKMCCLGVFGRHLGASDDIMLNKSYPEGVDAHDSNLFEWMGCAGNNPISLINDAQVGDKVFLYYEMANGVYKDFTFIIKSEWHRERLLRYFFRKYYDITPVFVG